MVAAPLFTRFGIPVRLDYYTRNDLSAIIRRSAGILEIEIEDDAVEQLVDGCRGTPRVANRLLRRMRDFAQVLGDGQITSALVRDGMKRMQIDEYGLEEQDRTILRAIVEMYDGGPVGAETLAISVGEELDSLELFYEPFLIQQGLIQRTARGRIATERAYRVLGFDHSPRDARTDNEDQRPLF
jgi:Holliday junction DNA helicase RuvB